MTLPKTAKQGIETLSDLAQQDVAWIFVDVINRRFLLHDFRRGGDHLGVDQMFDVAIEDFASFLGQSAVEPKAAFLAWSMIF